MSAMTSFTFSIMAAMGVRTPTWDGEGKTTTMVKPAACSLLSFIVLLPAVIEWQQMVNIYDSTCRETMQLTKFACITSGPSHKTAMAALPFTLASFVLWRLTNSYQVRGSCMKINPFSFGNTVLTFITSPIITGGEKG